MKLPFIIAAAVLLVTAAFMVCPQGVPDATDQLNDPIISFGVNDDTMGSVSVGSYENSTVTVTATATTGHSFIGWYSGSELISENATATFSVDSTAVYTATFEVTV
jgi:hypothetical protein